MVDEIIPAELAATIRQARYIVIFTGAGVSAESGIPTFRDAQTGLWEKFDAATLASPEAFCADAALVWGWYEWRRAKVMRAEPNPAHRAIAELARHAPTLTLVTQNVDDLHERAGSRGVIHLHGRLMKPRCSECNTAWAYPEGIPAEPNDGRRVDPPRCTVCAAPIRPGVVWFGEGLPDEDWQLAAMAAHECDLLLSVGTSALVYPAAELPQRAARKGAKVVQVNPQKTALDAIADWNLHGAAGELLPRLVTSAFPAQ